MKDLLAAFILGVILAVVANLAVCRIELSLGQWLAGEDDE